MSIKRARFLVEALEDLGADTKHMYVKHDVYRVQGKALEVNGIDIQEHDKIATPVSALGQELRSLLIKHSKNGAIKLIPVGHNVYFDLDCVYRQLLPQKEAQKYVAYRVLDTGGLGQALKAVGFVPNNSSGGLAYWVDHFKLEALPAHNAENDVLITIAVLKKMLARILQAQLL